MLFRKSTLFYLLLLINPYLPNILFINLISFSVRLIVLAVCFHPFLISIFSFVTGVLISLYSSNRNCKKTNKTKAVKEGIRHIVYAVIGYMIVYFVAFIREPFLEIFGKTPLGYSMAHSFMISLNTITATIINYYGTIKVSCQVDQEKVEKNLRKLDKYLDKKPVKKKAIKIAIKD